MDSRGLTSGVLIDVVFVGGYRGVGLISDGWVPLSEVVSAERICFTTPHAPDLVPLTESGAGVRSGVVVSDDMSWEEEVAADYETHRGARGSLGWLKHNDPPLWNERRRAWEASRRWWTMELRLRDGRKAYVSEADGFALRDLFGVRDLLPIRPVVGLG